MNFRSAQISIKVENKVSLSISVRPEEYYMDTNNAPEAEARPLGHRAALRKELSVGIMLVLLGAMVPPIEAVSIANSRIQQQRTPTLKKRSWNQSFLENSGPLVRKSTTCLFDSYHQEDKGDKIKGKRHCYSDFCRRLLLSDAVESGDLTKLVIELGADVPVQNIKGETILHWASDHHDVHLSSILVENGAALDIKDHDGCTALHKACEHGNVDIAALLIENGADVDVQNHDGNTALHCACHYGHLEMVKLLVKRGADVNAESKQGCTPLQVACNANQQNVVLFFWHHYPWLVAALLEL